MTRSDQPPAHRPPDRAHRRKRGRARLLAVLAISVAAVAVAAPLASALPVSPDEGDEIATPATQPDSPESVVSTPPTEADADPDPTVVTTPPATEPAAPPTTIAPKAPAPDAELRPNIDDEPPDPTDPPEPPETTLPPETDPPVTDPPPPPDPECDAPTGFPRPTGAIPPGYVYSPTAFNGAIADPQPDDTFAADAAGHAIHTGKLRTRVVNGQEQFLVCAHVGTNFPADALTPFATTGTGAHAPTIAPRVVLIDAGGNTTTHAFGAVDSTLAHYAGSTDVHEGFVRMWVPFTSALREPGFTVRVEIRGTPALAGGSTQVMGADEVFVHLGPPPVHAGGAVGQGLGVALDTGVLEDGPYDPGIDDLSSLLKPEVAPAIEAAIEAQAPYDVDGDVDWDVSYNVARYADATVRTLGTNVNDVKFDVVTWTTPNGTDLARLEVLATGTTYPHLTAWPRAWGVLSVTGGSCEIYSSVDWNVRLAFNLDIASSRDRLEAEVYFVDAWGETTSVTATGSMEIWWGAYDEPCSSHVGEFRDRIESEVEAKLDAVRNDSGLLARATQEINDALAPTSLSDGPLAVDAVTVEGHSFRPYGWYIPTTPAGSANDIEVDQGGIDLAAAISIDDLGGTRFGHSYIPSTARSLEATTSDRTSPAGRSFDVGLVVSGGTVNQILRSLTAGGPTNVGLLDKAMQVSGVNVAVHPSAAPLFLPAPPAGWDAPGNVNLFAPSVRISLSNASGPIPGAATVTVDVSAGLDATLDAAGRLVPRLQSSAVNARFLRLGPTTNQTAENGFVVTTVIDRIRQDVPQALGAMLHAYAIPDMRVGSASTQIHLRNLSIGTMGGGHLGIYADVIPDEPFAPITTTWSGPTGGQPTSFTTTINPPTDMPGSGAYTVEWLIRDRDGDVVYQSPVGGESATSKILSATSLTPSAPNVCTGELTVGIIVDVTISREWRTRVYDKSFGFKYPGTPPTNPPYHCNPDPEPEPEPEPDPDPPICSRRPWLCEEQP